MSITPKLTRVHRLDSVKLDETFFTEEGYLIDHPIVTSVGIFEYANPDGSIRRELRLPEHVFDEKSLATYEGKPIIITHDAGRVDKRNVEREIVGTILSQGYQDKDDVRAKIIIHGINEVKNSGLRELSLGYDLVLDETPGEWKGQPYDAIQTEIEINHLALVGDARAGDQARLNIDGETTSILKGGKTTMSKTTAPNGIKKTITAYNARRQRRLDEEDPKNSLASAEPKVNSEDEAPAPVSTPEDRVQLVKDRRDRRDQDGDPENPEAALGVIAQQDEDIDELLSIIEALEAARDFHNTKEDEDVAEGRPKVSEDEDEIVGVEEGAGEVTLTIQTDAMDRIVRERLKLGRLGDRLNLDGLEEMKPIDAKKEIVKKVNPSMRLDGKSAAYINAAFDAAVAQLGPDGGKDTNYQRRQASSRADGRSMEFSPAVKTGAERARERMMDRRMNGGNK